MKAQVFRYVLPLRRPLALRGQVITERTGFLLKLTGEDGRIGWGDAAPLPRFSRESAQECLTALKQFAAAAQGKTVAELAEERAAACTARPACPASASFAIDSALCACLAVEPSARRDIPPGTPPSSLHINALLAGTRDEILNRAAELPVQSFRCAKLKVGIRPVDEEIALVTQVAARLGARIALRLDANRAWDLDTAMAFAHGIQGCPIDYIEEPLRDPRDLPRFQEQSGMAYALDETIHEMVAPRRLQDFVPCVLAAAGPLFGHAKAWVWKPSLFHFPQVGDTLRRLATACARETGASPQLVLSAAFESGIGITALAHCAAALAHPETPAGLDTYSWLAEDVLEEPLPFTGGTLDLRAVFAAARRVDEQKLELRFSA